MALTNIVFNIAKGRVGELYNRVKVGDPATARLFLIPIDINTCPDETARDADDVAAIVTGGAVSRATAWANALYGIALAPADLTTLAANLDDANNWLDLDIPTDPVFNGSGAGVAAANNSTHLIVGYSTTTAPANLNQITPLTLHAFAVTTDGSSITAQVDPEGFYRAS